MTEAVVFDLDGVIVDSEQVWDDVREQLHARGRRPVHRDRDARDDGHELPEWSSYMAEELALPARRRRSTRRSCERMLDRYGESPPLIHGAADAVRRIASSLPLAVASSSNPELIDVVLRVAGLDGVVPRRVSSQEVERGKPAPDVYLEAARRLVVEPTRCVAVEDSHNGIRSAQAAGMRVFAVPNPHFPPGDDALALADVVLGSLDELTVAKL